MDARKAVDDVFRAEYGRVLATLIRQVGDFELAEDAVQDALAAALRHWSRGIPQNPGAWITTTARRKAIDRLRRDANYAHKLEALQYLVRLQKDDDVELSESAIGDDQLKLIFMCCHPALAPEVRVALTLRTLGGLTTPEIAKAFLTSESTMAQRIVRAKRKIKSAGIPYVVPDDRQLPERLGAVLAVIYLIFNEGYRASYGDEVVREDLAAEAIRLGRLVCHLMPNEPEAVGLLALMILHHARREARSGADGSLVLLPDQDRSLWDRRAIAEGAALVSRAMEMGDRGPYQVQAAIAAIHAEAQAAEHTDWREITALYAELQLMMPTPVVALNRAVAVAMARGPEAGLQIMAELADDLDGYHLFHSARADLFRRLGRVEDALACYRRAIELAGNEAERAFLASRVRELSE